MTTISTPTGTRVMSTPPKNTALPLFTRRFYCRVPVVQSRSAEHIRQFGVLTTGIPEFDRRTQHETQERYLTIMSEQFTSMLSLYRDNVGMSVINPKDTKVIYELIQDHLVAHRDFMRQSFHPGKFEAVRQDLLDLDKLAALVYPHAAPLLTVDEIDSLLGRNMNQVYTHSVDQLLAGPEVLRKQRGKHAPEETEEDANKSKIPERESMAEAFIGGRDGRGKPFTWR